MSLLSNFIKRFEGYATKLPNGNCTTYLCSAGVLTIGYGATGEGVWQGVVWTKEKAEQRLEYDLKRFSEGVFKLSPSLMEASESKQAAIISFAYNCGLNNYRNSSLRKAVNREDWEEAGRQILRWDKAAGKVVRGLTIRRQAESLLLDK